MKCNLSFIKRAYKLFQPLYWHICMTTPLHICMYVRPPVKECMYTHTHLLTRELHLCKDILWCVTMNGVYWPMQTQLVGRRIYCIFL